MATGGVGPPTEGLGEAPGPDGSRDETERRIDNMNYMTTIKEGKKLGIDFKSNRAEKLRERQWLIKWKTMCSSTIDIKPADILRTIEDDASLDTERRNELIVEFERAEQLQRKMVESKDKMLIDHLGKNGYGNDELFKAEITKLKEAKAPVLVLGETESGKTSFINLLLGANYFQHSILSNTHVVSKIQYGPKPKATLYYLEHREKKKEIPDQADPRPFKDQLSYHVTRSQNGRPVYSQADVYLPCEILQCGLVIVDSPGIGENDEMNQMVLDYILTACTFIYVIDSSMAGGVHMRMRELLNEAYKKAIEEDNIYNPATAIFICNKWDMVPKECKQATWNDTIRKIKEVWPYCKTEEQIFMFSTHEAAYIQDLGGVAPKYLKVLHKINELMPLGREMLVRKSYNKLKRFYSRMLVIMWSFMHQKGESDVERQTRIGHLKDRLKSTDKSINEYFDESTNWLEEEKTKQADALKQYLNQSKTEICTLLDSQFPTAEEWEKASNQIQLLVGENIQNQMTKWVEKNAPFKELASELYKNISETFPKFKKELSGIQMKFSPFKARAVHFQCEEEDEFTLLPKFISDKLEGSVGKKIGFGVLMSPLMLFSVAFRGPVKVGLMSKNATTDHLKQKEYLKAYSKNADKKRLCENYTNEVVTTALNSLDYNDIIRENIEQSFTLLSKLKQKMLQAVKQDKDLLKTLQQEKRRDKEITDTYQPLITQMEQGLTALHVFNVKAFGKCEDIFEDLQKLEPAVWSAAQMFKATSVKPFQTKNHQTVFVRKPNASDNVTERIKVLTAYRNLSHKSLVEYCGIVKIEQTTCQLMQPLVQSLRSFMSNVRSVDKRRSCFLALKDVTSGLEYLHGEGFVHFDLSLDTVFTDCHGQFKLTNIHPETSVRIPLLRSAEGFVYPAHYVHLPLRFLRSSHEPAIQYTARDDIYSLGIMMWEMFLGDHLVALDSKFSQDLGESEFQVGGRGSEFQVGGRGSEFQVSGQGSEFQQGVQESEFQVGGRGSEFQVSGQGSEFQLDVQESEFQVGGRGSEFQVGGRGSEFQVGGRGSEFQVGGRGSEFQVSGQGSGLHVGDQGSEFQIGGRGSEFQVVYRRLDFQVGGRGSGLHVGGQGSEFQIGGRGSEFQLGGRGSEFQVGGRLEPDSQHSTHELAGGISGADEAYIFELLRQTLKNQIEARKEELKSRTLSDEFWGKWRSILLGGIEQTHSVNQIAGELNSLKIV